MNKITTSIPNFFLRPASSSDAALILSLVKQLAVFEKLEHEVMASEELFQKNLFHNPKAPEVIIAEYEGLPVGLALYFLNFSTFLGKPGIYLEDLFIIPEMRNRGFGLIILKYIASIAVKNDYGRLEWSVLKWNKDAIRFYEKLNAKPMNEWDVYRLTGEDLKTLGK